MVGHIIVCGDDALGIRIVDELNNAGARVAAVQSDLVDQGHGERAGILAEVNGCGLIWHRQAVRIPHHAFVVSARHIPIRLANVELDV